MDLGNNGGGFLLGMQTEKTDNRNGDWQIEPTIVIGSFSYIILGKKFPILKSGRWLPSYISVKIPTNFLESIKNLYRRKFKYYINIYLSDPKVEFIFNLINH